jgi:hypothetical protein
LSFLIMINLRDLIYGTQEEVETEVEVEEPQLDHLRYTPLCTYSFNYQLTSCIITQSIRTISRDQTLYQAPQTPNKKKCSATKSTCANRLLGWAGGS